jgi:hypothetical protein
LVRSCATNENGPDAVIAGRVTSPARDALGVLLVCGMSGQITDGVAGARL